MITPILFIVAYLIGSISSAILLCRLFKLPDPREYGSKNPGTTNILRLAGTKLAAIVLVLDVLKGFAIVHLAKYLHVSNTVVAITSFAGFIGQLFPIFFKFRGGKGLAIALGIITALYWQLSILLILIWLLIFTLFRISSLAALITTIIAIITTFWLPHKEFAICIVTISILILFKHQQNIKNLINRTECKIKFN